MSHRWFTFVVGIVVSGLLAANSWAQSADRQMSLAERMAAMRRGWSGQAAQAQRQPARQQRPAAETPEDSGSIWSNLLGRKPKAPAQAPTRVSPPTANAHRMPQYAGNQMAIPPAAANSGMRTASRPAVNPATARTNSGNFTLPGLGGSPLPQAQSGRAQAVQSRNSQLPPHASGAYPVIQNSPLVNSGSARQPQSVQRSTASGSAATTRSAPRQSPRQSPAQRPAPTVDPEELRRELAGSFPATGNSEPVARTAQANETADSSSNSHSESSSLTEPTATADESFSTDTAETMPEVAEAPVEAPQVAVTPEPAIEPEAHSTETSEVHTRKSDTTPDYSAAFGDGFSSQLPRNKGRAAESSITRPQAAFGETGLPFSNDPTVLVSNETPVIASDIRGPKQIVMGREATYQVQLHNQSDVAAEGIVASIRIPSWAEVVDTTTTQGMIQQARGTATPGQLEWQLSRLDPRASETLDIRLIPRASRPLELGISWTLSPVGSRAIVQVQEPKLQMTVSGPDEVLFSEPQMFRLTLTNPGTGTAENVTIELIPPGDNPGAVTRHTIGDLPPGAMKTVEVELTAREAGKLSVKANAIAEGGLTSDASKEIFCRKPELEVDWRGPDTKYAGTAATYFVRVRNPGTAPADDVTVTVELPPGAEFTSASEGPLYDAKKRHIAWQIGTLSPGDDNYMELKCVVNTPGVNQLRINASSSTTDLIDEKIAETNVVALADLKLEVTDPSGPVAVGEQAIYEIRVQNRGANTANDVNIVALFSEGIEPDQVEGAMYTVSDGRVTFRAIEELQAGREVVLRIRAHAIQAGTHVFRAEVLCRELEIQLAAEETTRFYAEEIPPANGGLGDDYSATPSDGFQAATR